MIGLIDRRAGLEEQPDNVEVAILARDVHWRGAVVLGLIERRVSAEQQPDALEVALLARDEQRRGAVVLGFVDRRASAEEQLDALEVAPMARDAQRGGAAFVRRPHACAALQQQPHGIGLPVPSRVSQQRELIRGLEPRVEQGRERRAARPPVEEGLQRGQVPLLHIGERPHRSRRAFSAVLAKVE